LATEEMFIGISIRQGKSEGGEISKETGIIREVIRMGRDRTEIKPPIA
jgi:hypothetical protein